MKYVILDPKDEVPSSFKSMQFYCLFPFCFIYTWFVKIIIEGTVLLKIQLLIL